MKLRNRFFISLILTALLSSLLSCSTNPVTGKSQWSMPVSEQIAMGAQQYQPSQQQQGGRYVVDPEVNLYVSNVGQKVAAHADLELPYEFVVLNNDVPNAWALPGGKIAINRGLLVVLEDEAQLAAVLGHEVVHAAAEHSATQQRKSQLLGLGVVLAGVAGTQTEYGEAVALGAVVGAQAWQASYGRSQELQADKYGIEYMVEAGYDPQAAVELQQTFVKLSASAGKQDPISALFASHPPSQERVDKNKSKAAQYPGGTRNKTAFQKAIAGMKADGPAYELNTAALKKASEEKWDEALSLSRSAIKKQPKEAMFYLTEGRILMAQGKHKEADKPLANARKLNPEYFLPSLLYGLNARTLGQNDNAKTSLESSMKLMPTAIGAYNLGEIALTAGDKLTAKNWFNQAAKDEGDIGKKAKQQLESLNAG